MRYLLTILMILLITSKFQASYILIPMDETKQKNHLKAYGIAFWILQNDIQVEWLLNYRGGSFLVEHYKTIEEECIIRGVSYEIIANVQANQIKSAISDPEVNQEVVKLEKSPKVAVYTPDSKQPWDDAVTLVLTYAEIPYEKVYDKEVIAGDLHKYDWLHLHHEDFTGQYGKFYGSFRNAAWYKKQQTEAEATAKELGFNKVSELKRSVAQNIQKFTAGGGFLFTMCSGTDSYDIALAAQDVDICDYMFDGDASDPAAQSKLDYTQTFAFKDFILSRNPMEYEFSTIDATKVHQRIPESQDSLHFLNFQQNGMSYLQCYVKTILQS